MQIISKINYVYHHYPISHGSQRCMSTTTVVNKGTSEPTAILIAIHDQEINIETPIANQYQPTYLSMMHQPIYQPPPQIIYQPQQPIQTPLQNSTQMTLGNPRPRITQNWKLVMVVHQPISSSSYQPPGIGSTQNPNSQNYLSFLVIPEDATTNNSESNPPQTTLINNIPPAMVTKNKSLTAIFLFKLEKTINPLLFSGVALEEKLITTIYTDAKVDDYSIKLILDSGSASSIITRQLMD
ncbi:hypothetical protein G9A89_012416 [Geosiphon pyriformis]|nr:hypothetical protein G9A89_012416 [Geosiphon pyriformis]